MLIVAFVALNFMFAIRTPVRLGGDSGDYLADAKRIRQGQFPSEGRFANVGYSALIVFSQSCGAGLIGLVGFQIALAALAAAAVFDVARRLQGRWTGIIAVSALSANPDIVRWHTFILTDSLYTSFVVLAVWAIHSVERKRRWTWVLAILILLLTTLLRPNGWLFPPIAACFWLSRYLGGRHAAVISLVIVAMFMTGVVLLLTIWPGLSLSSVDANFREGRVVWGDPATYIVMPADEAGTGKGLVSVLGYVGRHPVASFRLMSFRVAAELGHVRAFYSAGHNLVIAVVLIPMYLLAVVGLFVTRHESLARLLVAVIAGHLVVVALTWADWDGRFLLYVFPLIGIFAACGLVRLVQGRIARSGLTSSGLAVT